MEDAHCAHLSLQTNVDRNAPPISVIGVFDGHCGKVVAQLCSQQLHGMIASHPLIRSDPARAISEAFRSMDRVCHQAVRGADGGSTAVVAVVIETTLYVANLGDARAVLVEADAASDDKVKGHQLTRDHKPTLPDERKRIEDTGSFVDWDRVGGCLAVSRAFGDFEFKQDLMIDGAPLAVSNIPEITVMKLSDTCKYLILACDGVWDVIASQESADVCAKLMKNTASDGPKTATRGKPPAKASASGGPLDQAAAGIVQLALDKMSTDNVSAMVISLHADDLPKGK
eukprot:NODE_2898_length_1018_cov_12.080495_g2423_i0.p1 GENE.NODE_2898_length_1018_cov_12.080495_g2423_i0~~NODE_2898_length_1018_cov_12.080495_g2423_i0.p1  ORF type:complete len:315 (+),score=27.73 NODE_2898_length_1018_cov_12.080495_g2423_i0:93-947(+)